LERAVDQWSGIRGNADPNGGSTTDITDTIVTAVNIAVPAAPVGQPAIWDVAACLVVPDAPQNPGR
jgi:hypothetical protein